MKQLHITFLLAVLMSMVGAKAFAYDIAVENDDGVTIYYNYISEGKELEVTYNGDKTYGNLEINIPETVTFMSRTRKVTRIGEKAFNYCRGLTSVTIPNSVTTIGKYAFEECTALTSITIPNSVKIIGAAAFEDCSGLTSINIPNSVTSIGDDAFIRCKGLTYINIPNSVKYLGHSVFLSCSGLTSITIGNSVTSIGWYAFKGCEKLSSITIPNSVTSIGDNAFSGCTALTSVTIPNSVTSIDWGAFQYCYGLTSITIPNSVTYIPKETFRLCKNLTFVTIPNSVTGIGDNAFYGCEALTSITIPNSVTSIGNNTFNCENLAVVISLREEPTDIENAFNKNTYNNATLYVPKGTIEKYKARNGWKNFIWFEEYDGTIPDIPDIPQTQKCATPSISYADKKLTFDCETEGVEFVYDITDTDIKHGNNAEVTLTATYEISVYATKTGYENSDVATATLVWSNAIFTETTPATAIAPAAEMEAPMPILIQNNGGTLTIQGAQDGTPISVYTIAGMQAGTAISQDNRATISTSMQQGDIAIIKIGERSVKIVLK